MREEIKKPSAETEKPRSETSRWSWFGFAVARLPYETCPDNLGR